MIKTVHRIEEPDVDLSLRSENVAFSVYTTIGDSQFYRVLLRSGDMMNILEDPFEDSPIPPTPPVPDVFEKVKYVEMTRSGNHRTATGQYIDIPYDASDSTIYYVRAKIQEGAIGMSLSDTSKSIIARDYGVGNQGAGGYDPPSEPGYIWFLYEEHGWESPVAVQQGIDPEHYYDAKTSYEPHTYIINYPDKYMQVDNNTIETMDRSIKSFSTNIPFSLGCWYEDDGHLWKAKCKIYEMYVIDKKNSVVTELVHLVPVMVKKGQTYHEHKEYTLGMYDFKNDEFYVNTGAGTLGYESLDGKTYRAPTLTN